LREGEFPYCIARRYNVDPEALIAASGLTNPDVYYAGLKLIIPSSGTFPGTRALKQHPASYTVASGDETVYSIACAFGDVDPNAIATTNGISASAKLTVGQVLQIP
jgi:LysM repeat protein